MVSPNLLLCWKASRTYTIILRRNKICLVPILEGQLKYTVHCQSCSRIEGYLGLRFGSISGNSHISSSGLEHTCLDMCYFSPSTFICQCWQLNFHLFCLSADASIRKLRKFAEANSQIAAIRHWIPISVHLLFAHLWNMLSPWLWC